MYKKSTGLGLMGSHCYQLIRAIAGDIFFPLKLIRGNTDTTCTVFYITFHRKINTKL